MKKDELRLEDLGLKFNTKRWKVYILDDGRCYNHESKKYERIAIIRKECRYNQGFPEDEEHCEHCKNKKCNVLYAAYSVDKKKYIIPFGEDYLEVLIFGIRVYKGMREDDDWDEEDEKCQQEESCRKKKGIVIFSFPKKFELEKDFEYQWKVELEDRYNYALLYTVGEIKQEGVYSFKDKRYIVPVRSYREIEAVVNPYSKSSIYFIVNDYDGCSVYSKMGDLLVSGIYQKIEFITSSKDNMIRFKAIKKIIDLKNKGGYSYTEEVPGVNCGEIDKVTRYEDDRYYAKVCVDIYSLDGKIIKENVIENEKVLI